MENIASLSEMPPEIIALHQEMMMISTNANMAVPRHVLIHNDNLQNISHEDDNASYVTDLIGIEAINHLNHMPRNGNRVNLPSWAALAEPEHELSSRKNKLMRCLLCEAYCPDAQWATLKERKYESKIFQKHEKSLNHVKATILSSIQFNEELPNNTKMSPLLAVAVAKLRADGLIDDAAYTNVMTAASATAATQQRTIVTGSLLPQEQGATINDNGQVLPLWLRLGDFVLSHPAAAAAAAVDSCVHATAPATEAAAIGIPGPGRKIKRRRLQMCTYCAEYNPSSPWGELKARKFEVGLLNSHQKGSFHIQAVQQRDLAIMSSLVNSEALHSTTL